jgi:arabinan endo-1,5-alpha-L-arabinosidase
MWNTTSPRRRTLPPAEPGRPPSGKKIAAPEATVTYQNPLCAENCADPAVLRAGGWYYLYTTSGNAAEGFPIRVSRDLVTWELRGSIFPAGDRPAWIRGDLWAPEVHRVGRRYVVYYTARDRARRLCLGLAWADGPLGPWTDQGRPFLRDERVGMIDSHYFRDTDGRQYLYWKADGNDLKPRERTPIYVQELAADGMSLVGRRRPVLENDREWEGDLVEGPWVVRRGAYYYLFYSGNAYYNANYAVGVSRGRSPVGPFVKQDETVLRRDENWLGPGHGCVVRGPDRRDYYIYHAWQRGRVGGKNPRMLLMDRIHWENGWPRINDGSPSAVPQQIGTTRPAASTVTAAVQDPARRFPTPRA